MRTSTIKNIAIVALVLVSFLSGYFVSEIQSPVALTTNTYHNLNTEADINYVSYKKVPNDLSVTFLELKNELGDQYDNKTVLSLLQEKYKTKVELIERMKLVLSDKQNQIKM